MPEENIYQKIDQQTELLETIVEQTKKTQKYIFWGRILSTIQLIIIVVPIIVAIIYLPPYIKIMMDKAREIIPGLEKIQEIIKDPTILQEQK